MHLLNCLSIKNVTDGIFDKSSITACINFMFWICLLEDPGFIETE